MAYMNCVKVRCTAENPTPEARKSNNNNNNNNLFLILTLKQRIIMANKISCELKKQLNSPNFKRQTKCMLCTNLIRLKHMEVSVRSSDIRMEISSETL
jgi:hypothetical protein